MKGEVNERVTLFKTQNNDNNNRIKLPRKRLKKPTTPPVNQTTHKDNTPPLYRPQVADT
jgi:hypothetical protein